MKYLNIIQLFLLLFISCSNDSPENTPIEDEILKCSPEKVTASATGGVYTLNVTCSRGEWTSVPSDDSNAWVSVKTTGSLSNQGTVIVTVDANKSTTIRNGSVIIKAGSKRLVIPIIQEWPLQVSKTMLYSNSKGETLTLTVTATDDWSVKSNDTWIKAIKTDKTTISVTTDPNSDKKGRIGSLEVSADGQKLTVNVQQESVEDSEVNTPDGYHLVWHDEFNEGTVLSSDWTHEVQKAGWVNNELQTYVNGSADGKRVTELVDGKLSINCFKGSDGKIYSGRVYAKVNTGWLYGYFEARILLPKGKGTWPAFWMMPANNDFAKNPWPDCGEIDIMEEVGVVPNEVSSSIHTKKYNHVLNTQKTEKRNIGTAESEYHIYACEWTPDYLKFFVDGKVLMTFNNEGTGKDVWPFTYNFYPILNLAWGGSWGGMNGVDESALPITMKVDYVRVFQKK